jgi:AGZA family xanthine/uracil permease-like MFS transporter
MARPLLREFPFPILPGTAQPLSLARDDPMNHYGWARRGDVNAFFGLMLDNVAVMVLLVGTITSAVPPEQQEGQYAFTREFVVTRMIPGTALGVLVGDLVYTWMAFRLARRTGRPDVTAMPLGLDTPSTFGVALLVLLPALNGEATRLVGDRQHLTAQEHAAAMLFAWHVGLVVLMLIGVFKVLCAPLGNAVRRWVPRAGLLGSLAAIALALIAFIPLLLDIATVPLAGFLALTVILVTLVAHRQLPGKVPGALAAVLLGVVVYWGCHLLDGQFGWSLVPPPEGGGGYASWRPPDLLPFLTGDAAWWGRVWLAALAKLPVALPFALATIVGGIDCTESAAAAGDEYDTRTILLTEGLASVLAGALGGVIQTTPYIGHPAYKAMGGRAAYTLATALFVGAAGYFGWFPLLFDLLPRAAMFPILVYVGLEITAQSFRATPERHYPALALAALPALAYLATIPLGAALAGKAPEPSGLLRVQTLRCLANGFIITSLLWAAALASILDGRFGRAAVYLLVAAACTFVGIIHSPLPEGLIDLPWNVLAQVPAEFADAVRFQTPYHWCGAYAAAAGLLLVLGWFARAEQPAAKPAAG